MSLPDPEAAAEAVFAALAEPTRRSILGALAARGPATATCLASQLPITRQAIAKHFELLAAAGLVLAEPGERRRIRYRVNAAPMAIAQSYLGALAQDWDSKLGRLRRLLDAPAPLPGAAARDRGRTGGMNSRGQNRRAGDHQDPGSEEHTQMGTAGLPQSADGRRSASIRRML